MSALYIVFPLALLIAAAAVAAFVWAVRSGQFDDLDTPPMRMLHDDESADPDGRGLRQPRPGPRKDDRDAARRKRK